MRSKGTAWKCADYQENRKERRWKIPHRCIGLKMFHPACGTVGCPFYKPREFATGYRTIVDGEVKFRKIGGEVSNE